MIKANIGVMVAAEQNSPTGRSALAALAGLQVPVAVAWQRLLICEEVGKHVARYRQMQNDIVKRYIRLEDVNGIGPGHPSYDEVLRELAALQAIEDTVSGDIIQSADLGQGQMSPQERALLRGWLIADPIAAPAK